MNHNTFIRLKKAFFVLACCSDTFLHEFKRVDAFGGQKIVEGVATRDG